MRYKYLLLTLNEFLVDFVCLETQERRIEGSQATSSSSINPIRLFFYFLTFPIFSTLFIYHNYVKEDKMITRSQFQGQQHYRLHLEDREMAFAHMCNVLLSFLKYQRSDQIRILDSLISERKQAILGRLFGEIDDHVENDSFDKVMPELNPVKMITKSLK